MLINSVNTDYRHALALCFERFAARGRALRLMQTAPSLDLGGTQDEAAEAESVGADHHGKVYPENSQSNEPSNLPDEAEQPSLEPSLSGPEAIGAASNQAGSSGACVRAGVANSQSSTSGMDGNGECK
jgi:hypothetical protein